MFRLDERTQSRNQEYEEAKKSRLQAAEKYHQADIRATREQRALRLNETRRPNENKLPEAETNNPENSRSPRRENLSGKIKSPLKKVKDLAGIVKSPFWILAFAAGIGCDLADSLPVASWPITLIVRPFLMIFLLFHGQWGRKVGRSFLLLLDFVPIIGFIPFSTACVLDAYLKSKDKKRN